MQIFHINGNNSIYLQKQLIIIQKMIKTNIYPLKMLMISLSLMVVFLSCKQNICLNEEVCNKGICEYAVKYGETK